MADRAPSLRRDQVANGQVLEDQIVEDHVAEDHLADSQVADEPQLDRISQRSSLVEEQEKTSSHSSDKQATPVTLWQRLYCNTWFSEILAMIFSGGCMIALAVVLRVYDGQTIPHMRFGLTPNAIASILATASRAALVCTIASTIGQLKWCWFTSNRKLSDLQAFDDASRGVTGSLTILFTFKAGILVSLGASITVLALAYDPFVQQIIKYPSRQALVPDSSVLTPNASSFYVDASSTQFLSSINAGLWSDANQFERKPLCPSGNCTWSSFKSIGWCSKCEDATSKAVLSDGCIAGNTNLSCVLSLDQGADITLFNGSQITAALDIVWALHSTTFEFERTVSQPQPNLNKTTPSDLTFLGAFKPLLVFGRATLTYVPTDPLIGFVEECVLTPCLRTYNVSVVAGKTKVKVLDTDYGSVHKASFTASPNIYNVTDYTYPTFCWAAGKDYLQGESSDSGNSEYQSVPEPCTSSSCLQVDYIKPAFCPVDVYADPLISRLTGTADLEFESIYYMGGLERKPVPMPIPDNIQMVQQKNLSGVLDNVAASLTMLGLELSNEAISGHYEKTEIYVQVDWPWLILPAAIEVAGVFVLVSAVFWSQREVVPLWKNSAMALLYHGLEDRLRQSAGRSLENVCSMNLAAEKMDVRLAASEEGDRTVLLASGQK